MASLQELGYGRVALGGMVPLKTTDILATLEAVAEVRKPDDRPASLGVTRCERNPGVCQLSASPVSTAPRPSAKPSRMTTTTTTRSMAHTTSRYVSRKTDGNASLKRRIEPAKSISTRSDPRRASLSPTSSTTFENQSETVDTVVDALVRYEQLLGSKHDHGPPYRATLEAAPWRDLPVRHLRRRRHRGRHLSGIRAQQAPRVPQPRRLPRPTRTGASPTTRSQPS